MEDESIDPLSKINLCSNDPSTINWFVRKVPSKTSTGLSDVPNCAIPLFTTVVMLSDIEKTKVVSSSAPVQTNPGCKVRVGDDELVCTWNKIDALAAVFDLGTYPIFLANETTFSRSVAESKNDSLTTKFELNAEIYVLYASVSIKTEKFDPSKSKSVKFEFALR